MTAESYYEPPERRPRPLRTALIVALLAFILGAALVTWALTRWEPARRLVLPMATTTSTPSTLQATPATAPVATLASTPAAPLSPEAVAVTESRVAGLEARLAQIDAQAANASSNAARAEGLLIAFAARRAIDRGVGLGYLEGQLRDRFAETQPRAVAAIISAAQAPVTLDALRQQLDVLTPNLAGGGPNEGWTAAAQRTLGSLFIVRKATSPSPIADDRISRARLAIEGGQVDDALAEIARLPSRAAAADWMASARRYVEAHRALDILEAAALTAPRAIPLFLLDCRTSDTMTIEAEWWDYDDTDELAEAVAGDVGFIIDSALDARGSALIAFPGGTTPVAALDLIAAQKRRWKDVTIIPTDDRIVEVTSPMSNVAMLAKKFLPLGARVIPLTGATAADYKMSGKAADARLADLPWPPDLVWLGMGADGHTASIFPGPDLDEALNGPKERRALGVMPDPLPAEAPVARVTLSKASILAARTLTIVLTGADKREVLERAIADGASSTLPIGRVLADSDLAVDIHWAE